MIFSFILSTNPNNKKYRFDRLLEDQEPKRKIPSPLESSKVFYNFFKNHIVEAALTVPTKAYIRDCSEPNSNKKLLIWQIVTNI